MSEAYEAVANAIEHVSGVDRAMIAPDKHIIEDMGVDSLDFLDITFEIDSALKIRLPIEDWLQQAKDSGDRDALVMKNFVAFVERTASEPVA